MVSRAGKFAFGSEFDDFLFALVGEDRNGMPLTVISVLARLDLDPWQEAASLAALPTEEATQKLVEVLDALPDPTLQRAAPLATATRLIALLPQRAATDVRASATGTRAVSLPNPRAIVNALLIAIYMILVIGIQSIVTRRDPPNRIDTVHAPDPPAVRSPGPPAN